MPRPLVWQSFGVDEPYEAVYQRQKNLLTKRISGDIPDTLLLGEHAPVITLGRGTHADNILNPREIPVVEIERGGDVTFHGPGQLVGYPILALVEGERDLHRYLRNLEAVLMRVLVDYGLEGRRNPGWTGVWVGERKVASIGVAVKKWVTFHGFALNVTTDLDAFNTMNPCGLPSAVMTSLAREVGADVSVEQVRSRVLTHFAAVFEGQFLPTS